MDKDWIFVMCEKDISLFQNENNYKITFNLKNTGNTYNDIIDIIKNNDLFELLYELNKDVIQTFTLKSVDAETYYANIKVINKNLEYFDYENLTFHVNYSNKIEETKGVIYSKPFNNNDAEDNSEIYLSNFIIEISNNKDNISFLVKYSFDKEIFDSNLINTSISMHIIKILYRLKLYFE